MVNNQEGFENKQENKNYKVRAMVFLGTVTGVSGLIGFSKTLAAAKRQEHKILDKGQNSLALLEGGTALAMRALAWGSFYAILGTGFVCYGIWKLSGAKNIQEFREKIGTKLPKLSKNEPPTSRTEFENLTDLMKYLATWGKE